MHHTKLPLYFFLNVFSVLLQLVKDDVYLISVKGGTIHMVCRNKDKAEEARADIVKESGNKVQYDSLSSLRLWLSRHDIIHYSECNYRRSTSTSWTCLRPRRSGSLLRPSRESTRPSMCWWETQVNCFHIWKYMPIYTVHSVSVDSMSVSFRSTTQAPSWVRGMWTLRGLRRALPPTSSVSQTSGVRHEWRKCEEKEKMGVVMICFFFCFFIVL